MDTNLTLEEAADIASRDTSTMRRAIRKGSLKATKYGTTWVVKKADLESWMKSDTYNEKMRRG